METVNDEAKQTNRVIVGIEIDTGDGIIIFNPSTGETDDGDLVIDLTGEDCDPEIEDCLLDGETSDDAFWLDNLIIGVLAET